jgi:outer membrane protein OmpA-like peptidoglycan-associated protein
MNFISNIMINPIKISIVLLCFPFLFFGQQQYTGLSSDNFSGYNSSYLNPASIVNTTNKFSITSSLVFLRSNNYLGANSSAVSSLFGNDQDRYRSHSSAGYEMNNVSFDIVGMYYEINHDNSIGYSLRIRQFGNVDGLPEELTLAKDNNFDNTKPINTPIDFSAFNFSQFIYTEHRFNYARVIQDETPHFIKAGAAFKLINGHDATYLYADEGSYEFTSPNGANGDFTGTQFRYGRAEKDNTFASRNLGVGFDLGVVYEYRPDPDAYKYDMDGETDIVRYDQKKYLFKIAASINDIGRVKFSKDTSSYDFTNDGDPVNTDNISSLGFGGGGGGAFNLFKTFDVLATDGVKSDDNEETFKMNLPTTFNLMGDYNIWKNFYASWTSVIPLKRKRDPHKSHFKAIHTITPRYETLKISVMVPLSFQRNGQINLGLAGRYQFDNGIGLFAGGNNFTGWLGKRASYTQNFFAGISYSVPYKVPKDTDNDKVSDGRDECIYDPGPLALEGCPDTDKDGIPDKEDYCIYDQGPKRHNGCPDTDGDGVIDLNDQCPDTPGLPVHYGCPDRDRDGIIDVADQCPDVPGIELNNGCPIVRPACCTDDDDDGFPNDLDECPDVPGSVYNNGCPIDSTNLNEIQLQKIKEEKDPNHTMNEVEIIEENQEDKEELNEPEQIQEVEDRRGEDRLTIYFNVDDATISPSDNENIQEITKKYGDGYRFKVIGHTDNDASENYNLILSRKRAEVVKRKLMSYDIDYDDIEVMYFGEWKPLRNETKPGNKRFNRRVEIIIVKK